MLISQSQIVTAMKRKIEDRSEAQIYLSAAIATN
jgi:hypothetical protein